MSDKPLISGFEKIILIGLVVFFGYGIYKNGGISLYEKTEETTIFDGKTTGTPIGFAIYNTNQKSKDYDNVKDLFRPGHADFTYFHKYGLRDYRGGGRSSARETAARVAGGAIAKLMLKELGVSIQSGLCEVDGIKGEVNDFEYAKSSKMYALDPAKEAAQEAAILTAKEKHDSVGGVVLTTATGVPIGLGEPLYYKLDAILAEAMMGINAAKAVEIGDGVASTHLKGSHFITLINYN